MTMNQAGGELGSEAGWRPRILNFRPYGPWIARRRGGGWSLGSVEGPGGGGFGRRAARAGKKFTPAAADSGHRNRFSRAGRPHGRD
jgi:hypothetical protein